MKKILFAFSVLIACGFIFASGSVYAEDAQSAEGLFEEFYNGTNAEKLMLFDEESMFSDITGYPDIKSFVSAVIKGDYKLSLKNFGDTLSDLVLYEMRRLVSLIVTILVLCILYSVLINSTSSYLNQNIKTAVFCAAFLSLCAILVNVFYGSIDSSSEVISSLVSFMNAFIPFLMFFIASSGGVSTSALLSPTLLFFTNLMTYLINSVVIPISVFGFIMTMADNFLESVNISYLCKFLKKACYFILGACFTLFGAIVGLEGVVSSSVDSAAVRTAKYTVSTLVPVIGGFLSDSADTVNGFLLIIKNSFGIAGVLLICCIVIVPVVKMFCVYLSLRLCSIIIQPIAEERIGKVVDSAASYLIFITACVAASGVMFIVITGILIYFGNYMIMMR